MGRTDAQLTFMSPFGPHGAAASISGQVYLSGGSLRVDGFVRIPTDGPARFTIPIIGGTGSYAGARGVLTSRDLGGSDNSKSAFAIDLLP